MKRFLIVLVLMVCLAAVAFATLRTARHKSSDKVEKKECTEKKECNEKKECTHTCPYTGV